jgi:hypothetical protein
MKIEKIKLVVTLLLFLSLLGSEVFAQLSISAEFRPRAEIRNAYRDLSLINEIPCGLISQRSRLSFNYKSENIRIHFTPQDVRTWGDEDLASSTGVYGDNSSLSMFEGYAEIRTGKLAWLSVGRQQIVYDQQRIFGARNWNQNGLAYDAIVLRLELKNQLKLHIGSSWNSKESLANNYYDTDRIKSINYIWINKSINETSNISFLHVSSGVTQSESSNNLYFRHTTGIFSDYKGKNLNSWGNIYYQYGKNNLGTNVSALLLDASVDYQIGKLSTGAGVSYLTGNNDTLPKTDHLFNNLYGARHRYFGEMDYFRNFASHTYNAGLSDIFVNLKYQLFEKLTINNKFHYFRLANNNQNTPTNKNLGFENDLIINWKIYDSCALKCGYIFYIPSNSFKELKGVSDNSIPQFVYLQLSIKPTIFKSKKL